MTKLNPTQRVPKLEVATIGGGIWKLSEQKPAEYTLIEFYRGYHCPRCHVHLLDLDHKIARFAERGVGVIAISTDGVERAEKTHAQWGFKNLTLGYGLSLEDARAWGLHISNLIAEKEPRQFAEPGMFLVRPDGTLYASVVNTTPFFRSHFADIMEALDMIKARDYPPRGDAT